MADDGVTLQARYCTAYSSRSDLTCGWLLVETGTSNNNAYRPVPVCSRFVSQEVSPLLKLIVSSTGI